MSNCASRTKWSSAIVTVGLFMSMPCACAGVPIAPAAASHSARIAPSRSDLLQQRVEETVMPFVRKNLARELLCVGMRPGESQALRIAMAFEKAFDLRLVFLVEHRARCVQEFTTTREQLPKRVEDRSLALRECRDIFGSAQPLDIGMASHDARRRARHVREYVRVRPTVPPRGRLG